MQNYTDISPKTTVANSLPALLNNDKTALSNSAGPAFPTANLVEGMTCWRTDEQKMYVLRSVDPATWVEVGGGKAGLPVGYRKTRLEPTGANLDEITVTGSCRDSTNTADIVFSVPFKKVVRLSAGWVAGNGAVGSVTSLANDESCHVYALLNPTTGEVDVCFDQALAPLSLPAGFSLFRRIGSFWLTQSKVYPFAQFGNYFHYGVAIGVLNNSAVVAGWRPLRLPCPQSVMVRAWMRGVVVGAKATAIKLYAGGNTDAVDDVFAQCIFGGVPSAVSVAPNTFSLIVPRDASVQITSPAGAQSSGVNLILTGYEDFLED